MLKWESADIVYWFDLIILIYFKVLYLYCCMDKKFVDFYQLLNLKPDADSLQIKYSFKSMMKKFHPDKNI